MRIIRKYHSVKYLLKNHKIKLLLSILIIFCLFSTYYVFRVKLPRKKFASNLNVLLISIDTLRADHMGIYDYARNTTPNIDKWAKDSVVFKKAMTLVPMTYPSFSMLMTGLDPFQTRIFSNYQNPYAISNNTNTLAKILAKNGYHIGVFMSTIALNATTNMVSDTKDFNYLNYMYDPEKEAYVDSRKDYETLIDNSLNWIGKNKGKKFFLWVHLMDPHAPYDPPEQLKCKFDKKQCSSIKNKAMQELINQTYKTMECQQKVSKDTLDLYKTLYDGEIAEADILAGKILNKLKNEGLDKNTLIILYGDHGEGFDHDYNFNHRGALYNSETRIPLIIHYPLITSSVKTTDRLVTNTDILPTILDLLSIPRNKYTFDGKSFSYVFRSKLLTNILPEQRDYIIMTNDQLTKFAIYDGRYKFIYSTNSACKFNDQKEEFYDLKEDPQESKNIIVEKKDLAEEFKRKLLNYLSVYNLPSANDEKDKKGQESTEIIEKLKSVGY